MGVFTLPNPNYNQTITIFNRYKENGKEHWKRTVLHNCFWKCETHVVLSGTSSSKANSYTARIPKDARYIPCGMFTDVVNQFSLKNGDLCILGDADEVITGASGHTATDVLQKYKPNSFKITAVADNTAFVGGHYRIGG